MWDTPARGSGGCPVRRALRVEYRTGSTRVRNRPHTITADDWQVTFRLDDAQTIELTYWILEDPEFGVLNETTRVA